MTDRGKPIASRRRNAVRWQLRRGTGRLIPPGWPVTDAVPVYRKLRAMLRWQLWEDVGGIRGLSL